MKRNLFIGLAIFALIVSLIILWPRVAKAPLPDTSTSQVPALQGTEKENLATPPEEIKRGILTSGKIRVRVEIAETENELELGLGDRDTIGDDAGMLFILPESDSHGIWMQGMRFPLDILWLDNTFRVVYMKRNAAVETYPEIFYPDKPALYVLEMKGGAASKQGIGVGTTFAFTQHLE